LATETTERASALDLLDWDHLHFFVGNAKQAAHYYATAFGFRITAYAGPETGVPGRASYLLEQNDLRFVVTSALRPDDPAAAHVALHGDGINDIALRVPDAAAAHAEAVAAGARSVSAPQRLSDADGSVVVATIATYGDTVHTFVERDGYAGTFLPGFVRSRRAKLRRTRPACARSITAWATSAGTRWTPGPTSTAKPSASANWCRSTIPTSRPSTRRCARR
jgi:4-hydroxyphenylpyruvate dioxygenase